MNQRIEQEIMKNWKGDLLTPIVSICCVTYNHEAYISDAIDGFLKQETDFPFEILIRDDCSTDQTTLIVKEYADKYPTLIKPVYEKENTFSKGVRPMPQLYKRSKGIYIALCEGDDYWIDPLKLQKQVRFLDKNDDYVMSFHNVDDMDRYGNIVLKNKIQNGKDYSQVDLMSASAYCPTCTMMFRNINLKSPSMFDNIRSGDLSLWHLLGFHGKSKFQEEIKNSKYRIHSGGVWSGLIEMEQVKMSIESRYLLKEHLRTRSQKEALKKIHKNIHNLYIYHLTNFFTKKNLANYKCILELILKNENIRILPIVMRHFKLFLEQRIKSIIDKSEQK